MEIKSLVLATALGTAQIGVPSPGIDTMRLVEIQDEADANAWQPVHDGVMGGVSSGRSSLIEGAVRFEGRVSLDNNGGFASFRRTIRLPDLAHYEGLRLVVRGDGHTYKLSLRTDEGWDGVGWQASFATREGEWLTVDVAFEDLMPTWRGRLVPDAGPFNASSIREVGIVIADKQEGPFVLDLRAIDAWRTASGHRGSGTDEPPVR